MTVNFKIPNSIWNGNKIVNKNKQSIFETIDLEHNIKIAPFMLHINFELFSNDNYWWIKNRFLIELFLIENIFLP